MRRCHFNPYRRQYFAKLTDIERLVSCLTSIYLRTYQFTESTQYIYAYILFDPRASCGEGASNKHI